MSTSLAESKILEKLLMPKAGYTIQEVIGTTYTFSRRMLLEIMLRIYCSNNGIQIDNTSMVEKKVILAKFHEGQTDKRTLYLFKDESETNSVTVSGSGSVSVDRFLLGIENYYITKVSIQNGNQKGIFHPKIMLVRLVRTSAEQTDDKQNDDEKVIYRFYVGSKNLVWDSFYQNGVLFEGRKKLAVGNKNLVSKELSSLLKCLPRGNETFSNILDELNNVDFVVDDNKGLKNMQFAFGGFNEESLLEKVKSRIKSWKGQISDESEQIFCQIMTDSLGVEFDKYVQKQFSANIKLIVSNPARWDRWETKIQQNEELKVEEKVIYPQFAYVPSKVDGARKYIHAKNFVFTCASCDDALVIMGSANATKQAFENNCEAVVIFQVNKERIWNNDQWTIKDFEIEPANASMKKEIETTLLQKKLKEWLGHWKGTVSENANKELSLKLEVEPQYKCPITDPFSVNISAFGSGYSQDFTYSGKNNKECLSLKFIKNIAFLQKGNLFISAMCDGTKIFAQLDVDLVDSVVTQVENQIKRLAEKPSSYLFGDTIQLTDLIPSCSMSNPTDNADLKLAKQMVFGNKNVVSYGEAVTNLAPIISLYINSLECTDTIDEFDELVMDEAERAYLLKLLRNYGATLGVI